MEHRKACEVLRSIVSWYYIYERLFKPTLEAFEWEQEAKFKGICSGGV